MLKHLKGARVMVDCETGQLFVDAAGQCLPMGAAGGGCHYAFIRDNVATVSEGLFEAVVDAYTNFKGVAVSVFEMNSDSDVMSQYHVGQLSYSADDDEVTLMCESCGINVYVKRNGETRIYID